MSGPPPPPKLSPLGVEVTTAPSNGHPQDDGPQEPAAHEQSLPPAHALTPAQAVQWAWLTPTDSPGDSDESPGEDAAPDTAEGSLSYSVTRLSSVAPEQVQWLWPSRIPLGKITVLDGDPGLGKSTLALDIAAHVTTGSKFWDGTEPPKGAVLLLSGEDGLADTVRPRLDAAGADAAQVHALTGVRFTRDGATVERDPHLGDVTALAAAIQDHGVRLLIVDVLMAFLPSGTDSHRDQDVRAVLRRLKDVAEASGAAVLLLRHLNKSGAGAALYRGGGSIGIVGAARAGLLVATDPDQPDRVILAPTKSNLAVTPPACAYRLVSTESGVARVEWLGETAHHRADDLVTPTGDDPDERDALGVFLRDLITDEGGELAARDAMKAITKAFGQVPKATVKRARDRAGIASRKGGMATGWVWWLPDLMPDEPPEGSTKVPKGPGSQSPEPSEPSMEPSGECSVCGTRLDSALPSIGLTTHVNCSEVAS